ncbi:MAG: hypothetical protein PHF23_09155 [Smithellaceae bacterium]|nr:hypothetical protein [Smithellaceae bacterium]
MKVYLDACVYNRPFDDQKQPRIAVEAMEAVLLLSLVEVGKMRLVGSFVLKFENDNNLHVMRRYMIDDMMNLTEEWIDFSDNIMSRAQEIEKDGIMGLDAIHLACAEAAQADYFITCDDVLIKKARQNKLQLKVKVVSLMNFMSEEVFDV